MACHCHCNIHFLKANKTGKSLETCSIYRKKKDLNPDIWLLKSLISVRQTPVRSHAQHISQGSSNIAIRSYHKMDIASLSGAVYGVGQAFLLCMGLFWAGLSLSLDSIYRSLATGQCSVQTYRHPRHTTPSPPTQQQINTVLCHHDNQLLMSPPVKFSWINSWHLYNNIPTWGS